MPGKVRKKFEKKETHKKQHTHAKNQIPCSFRKYVLTKNEKIAKKIDLLYYTPPNLQNYTTIKNIKQKRCGEMPLKNGYRIACARKWSEINICMSIISIGLSVWNVFRFADVTNERNERKREKGSKRAKRKK